MENLHGKKFHLTLDDQNRIHLPEEIADWLGGAGSEVMLVGVLNRLELTTISQYQKEEEKGYAEETLANLSQLMKEAELEETVGGELRNV